MYPFCLSFLLLNQNPKTTSNMKESENDSTLPTYFILKLCFKLRREVDTQCYRLYPLYIAEIQIVKSPGKKQLHQWENY